MPNIQMVGTAWLFHVGKKYYVTHGFAEDLCDLKYKADPIDEIIAEPVMKLCNKGYETLYSCSGHPFNDCVYKLLEDEQKEAVNANDHIMVAQLEDTDALVVCDIDKAIDSDAYISFKEEQVFPCLPEGWTYSENVLRKTITASSVIEFYKKQIQAIEKLSIWIDSLPSTGIR